MPREKKTANAPIKITFDARFPQQQLIIPGTRTEMVDGERKTVQLFPDIVIEANQVVEISPEVYEILIKEKILMTKEEKEEIDALRQKLFKQTSGRAEPKGDVLLSDEEKKKVFGIKPYVVE